MRVLAPPNATSLAGKIDAVKQLEADGFAGAFLPSMGHDAMTVLAWRRVRPRRSSLARM